MTLHRRALLLGGVALSFMAKAVQAQARNNSLELITKFTGGAKPVEGKIKLDVPEIAENGNTVPITFTVDTPQSATAYVSDVLVVSDGNPQGGVAKFSFLPDVSVPEANFRMRLAETQNIIVVAKMNDGAFYTLAKQIKVTIGGCGG